MDHNRAEPLLFGTTVGGRIGPGDHISGSMVLKTPVASPSSAMPLPAKHSWALPCPPGPFARPPYSTCFPPGAGPSHAPKTSVARAPRGTWSRVSAGISALRVLEGLAGLAGQRAPPWRRRCTGAHARNKHRIARVLFCCRAYTFLELHERPRPRPSRVPTIHPKVCPLARARTRRPGSICGCRCNTARPAPHQAFAKRRLSTL